MHLYHQVSEEVPGDRTLLCYLNIAADAFVRERLYRARPLSTYLWLEHRSFQRGNWSMEMLGGDLMSQQPGKAMLAGAVLTWQAEPVLKVEVFRCGHQSVLTLLDVRWVVLWMSGCLEAAALLKVLHQMTGVSDERYEQIRTVLH